MIHLDANFLVEALQVGSLEEAQLDSWLAAKEIVGISAVAWAEFRCGPLSKHDEASAERMFSAVEPLMGPDATNAAALFNQTGRRSRSLADCMIPAVAIRRGARIATLNTAAFHKMHYDPHGHASIGDDLVVLANKRYLIDRQGNYGNTFTGDPAAAPRYIECRLSELARAELFNDEITDFVPSYDGRMKEPVTL